MKPASKLSGKKRGRQGRRNELARRLHRMSTPRGVRVGLEYTWGTCVVIGRFRKIPERLSIQY